MKQVFLSFGSNVGKRRENIEQAIAALKEIPGLQFVHTSHLYETEPVGKKDQPFFLNMVAEFRTSLSSDELLRCIKEIERVGGRVQRERWGPREIDIDILFYGDECRATETLILPHPEIANRKFVLVPLAEIAPDVRDPRSKKLIRELLQQCPDSSSVQQVE